MSKAVTRRGFLKGLFDALKVGGVMSIVPGLVKEPEVELEIEVKETALWPQPPRDSGWLPSPGGSSMCYGPFSWLQDDGEDPAGGGEVVP